jgi:hypothetical protein
MTTQTLDRDRRETSSNEIADKKIGSLLHRLQDKNVCPECTARAMALHAAAWAEQALGSAKAIQLFEEMIAVLRKHNAPAPERGPSATAH